MGNRQLSIPKQTLDVIHMLMKALRNQLRYLGAYVKADGNRADAAKIEQQALVREQAMNLVVDDECPEGFHLENGICVPD